MTESDGGQITQAINQLWKSRTGLLTSLDVAHLVGYALLILAVFDVIALLIPPDFGNPGWQFNLFGQLIERIPVPVIGLALVFVGGQDKRPSWELPLLSLTSWLTFIIGIMYFLMIPWASLNTLRLYRQANNQINAQIEQGKAQIEEVRSSLGQVNTDEDMARLLSQVVNQTVTPEDLTEPISSVKETLQTSLAEGEATLQTQAAEARSQGRLELFKNSIKWNLGAFVSGAILVLMWKSTDWARTKA
ncbi:HpsJ-like protein, cyanoexosortase A-associated [Prochlorothrix hollandica]|uniref:HpsJ-like protein, cyanoexosortase A-associated n=1 Tax=Prochlorothrix hollandica TaxID=1223 RepID=UPI00333E3634